MSGESNPCTTCRFRKVVKHFIAETKGSMESLQLKPIEQAKISCASKLFNHLSSEKVVYGVVDSYQTLLNRVIKDNSGYKQTPSFGLKEAAEKPL